MHNETYECIFITQLNDIAYKSEEVFAINDEESDDVVNAIRKRLQDRKNECKKRDEYLKINHTLKNLIAMITIDESGTKEIYLKGKNW